MYIADMLSHINKNGLSNGVKGDKLWMAWQRDASRFFAAAVRLPREESGTLRELRHEIQLDGSVLVRRYVVLLDEYGNIAELIRDYTFRPSN